MTLVIDASIAVRFFIPESGHEAIAILNPSSR